MTKMAKTVFFAQNLKSSHAKFQNNLMKRFREKFRTDEQRLAKNGQNNEHCIFFYKKSENITFEPLAHWSSCNKNRKFECVDPERSG